jgi:hypothetical protein
MSSDAPIIVCAKAAMFGDGTQTIDDTPQREIRQYPHDGVQPWMTRKNKQ